MITELINKIRRKMAFYFRLTRPYISIAINKQGESILDVGCGKGESIKVVDRNRRLIRVGADIFEPHLKECQMQGTYDELVLCNVLMLPFQIKSFDIVVCLDVIEHMEKEEGRRFITYLEKIARKQVIIDAPVGICKQKPLEGNPYYEHKSTWTAIDFKNLGYTVRGFGVYGLYGEQGLRFRLPRVIAIPFCSFVFVLSSPFTFFFPSIAGDMVCTKKLRPDLEKTRPKK
jgi:SAM-dependent methyltransferase